MTAYNAIVTFGSVSLGLSDVRPSSKPSTLKTNLGQTFIEHDIPMRNLKDTVLSVNGVITGLSRTSAQTVAQAIEIDRTALEALEDGDKHAYDDGRHSGNFVIAPSTLIFEDTANNMPGEPQKFTMELIQWQ